MSFESNEEALAFIESNRLMFEGKTGFRHYAKKLGDLRELLEALILENRDLRERLTFLEEE